MHKVKANELREYCIGMVKRITDAAPEDKEKLFEEFHARLSDELEGVDYMEYKNGVVTDVYINFDSNCGLSIITASQEINKLSEYMKGNSLEDACSALCDDGSRTEYWDDLVDEDYNFEGLPEDIADSIVSVLDEWVGEEEFRKEITK